MGLKKYAYVVLPDHYHALFGGGPSSRSVADLILSVNRAVEQFLEQTDDGQPLWDDEPEVMVVDLKMPGIDGLEVLRRVKKEHPGIEVIILTGHGSEKEKEQAMELGAFAYLQKPADIDVLAETMKNAYRKTREGKSTGEGSDGE